MYGPSNRDWLLAICLVGVAGWAVIEILIWVLRHLRIG